MHNHPNPNDLDGALLMLGALALLFLAGAFWIEEKLHRRKERQRRAIEEAREQAGAEAYIHRDRCN